MIDAYHVAKMKSKRGGFHVRIYALWTPKVRNNNAHICAMDPKVLNSGHIGTDPIIAGCPHSEENVGLCIRKCLYTEVFSIQTVPNWRFLCTTF